MPSVSLTSNGVCFCRGGSDFNPRLLAARAWDFTVWMGFLSQMPDEC
jgi:hypothetical protein